MTQPAWPPLYFCDVEIRQSVLSIRMRDKSAHTLAPDWWTEITKRCPGPFQAIWVDLYHCSVVSSSFIAGALQLRDYYENTQCKQIHLINAGDRITRLIEIMNLNDYFIISDHGNNPTNPLA